MINIRAFRANITKELNNLPIAITRRGKIIAEVIRHKVTRGGDRAKGQTSETFNPQPKNKDK